MTPVYPSLYPRIPAGRARRICDANRMIPVAIQGDLYSGKSTSRTCGVTPPGQCPARAPKHPSICNTNELHCEISGRSFVMASNALVQTLIDSDVKDRATAVLE